MKKKAIVLCIVALAACLLFAMGRLWFLGSTYTGADGPAGDASLSDPTPEEQLLGLWVQTQEHLDYENENIHSPNVQVTEKSSLRFNEDGSCIMEHPYQETVIFSWEYRDDAIVFMADGWAPWQLLFEDGLLLDPVTHMARYTKAEV